MSLPLNDIQEKHGEVIKKLPPLLQEKIDNLFIQIEKINFEHEEEKERLQEIRSTKNRILKDVNALENGYLDFQDVDQILTPLKNLNLKIKTLEFDITLTQKKFMKWKTFWQELEKEMKNIVAK